MALAICSMCFKRKDCSLVYPETEPVCRGCFMDLDRATGYLEHYGWGLIHGTTGQVLGIEGIQIRQDEGISVAPLPSAPDDPPNPPSETKEAPVGTSPKGKVKGTT